MNVPPRVSVLMSVRNEIPERLATATQSILSQTWRDLELVLVDDGGDDAGTAAALEGIARSDARVRLIRSTHRGLTAALNLGLAECRGEFVARQDSDDWSEPDRLARQILVLDQDPAVALVGSQAMLHQEDGKPLWVTCLPLDRASVLRRFPEGNPFCHGAATFRRAAVLRLGGYRERFKRSQDYDLFWRLCEAHGGENLDAPLYHLRKTRGSISASWAVEQARAAVTIRALAADRREGVPERLDEAASIAERTEFPGALSAELRGDALLLAGHYCEALSSYVKAARQAPLGSRAYMRLVRGVVFAALPVFRRCLF